MKNLILLIIINFIFLVTGHSQNQSDCSTFDDIIIETRKTCEGTSIGSIQVIIPEGTKDKERPFVISLNPGDVNRATPGDTTVFENLAAGPYQIMISDGAFCVKIIKDTVKTERKLPFFIVHENAGYDDQCEPINSGTAIVHVIDTAFIAGYSLEWSNGATTYSNRELDVGKYYVTVTNDIGLKCTQVDSIEITRDGKTNREGFNFDDPGDETFIDRESNIKIGMGSNGTNAILTENTTFSSFQFDLLPDVADFQQMNARLYNHTTDDMFVIIFHRDSNGGMLQRFPNQILPPLSNQTLNFNFDQPGKSTDRIQFLVDSETGSGPINGEVDDIVLLNRVLPPSDDLLILNGPLSIDEFQELNIPPDQFLRSTATEPASYKICNPDTIPLRSGFIIQGGTTPYTLSWDLDGDGLFDDAFGDSAFVVNLSPGIYDYGLKVTDADNQTDTSLIKIEILLPVQYQISFPDLDVTMVQDELFVSCLEDGLFLLRSIPPGGTITGAGIVNDSFFDPQLAGPGGHILSVNGNSLCDQQGLVTINVQPKGDPSWEAFSITSCDAPIVLSQQITDPRGDWYINDILSADAIFDPASFSDDSITLTYAMGLPPCNVFETKTLFVKPASDPTLTVGELNVDACAGTIDLNSFIAGDSSGTWSGGDYILNDTLDPMLLQTGSYLAIYSVGEGDCLRSDTLTVQVTACATSTDQFADRIQVVLFPNPAYQDEILIELELTEPQSLSLDILSLQGQILKTFGTRDIRAGSTQQLRLNPGDLSSGIYLIRFRDGEGNQLMKRWSKIK